MKKSNFVEIERRAWTEFRRRESSSHLRRRKMLAGFNRPALYRTADRVLDAFADYRDNHPKAWPVVTDLRAVIVPVERAEFLKGQPLEPEQVGFNCFSWRQDKRHWERGVSIYELSWALWIIECDNQEREALQRCEAALIKLENSVDRRFLAQRVDGLVRRYPQAAQILKPVVTINANGQATVCWTQWIDEGLPYGVFKIKFKMTLHRQQFAIIIHALTELGLIEVEKGQGHSAKRQRGNIYTLT